MDSVLPNIEKTRQWRRQHQGLGTAQLVYYSSISLSLAENKQWLGQQFLQDSRDRCYLHNKGALHSRVILKIIIKKSNPNKAKLLSSSNSTLQHPNNSNLIFNSSHSLHLNDNPRPVCAGFHDGVTGPRAELKPFLLLKAGQWHDFVHRRGKLRVI